MSSRAIEKTAFVRATTANCMAAFKSAIGAMDKYSIRQENSATCTIEVDKKAELKTGGYGENISFVARPKDGGSDISVIVSPKGLPYALWRANCEKVAQTVFTAFSDAVQQYVETAPTSNGCSGSVADEIRKFKELLDMGAITQEEYNAKKAQLLGL